LHRVSLADRFRSIQQYLMFLREAGEASRPAGPRCLFLLAGASIAFPFACCSHLVPCLPCTVPQAFAPLSSPRPPPFFLVSMQPPCQTSTFHRQPWFVAYDPLRRFPSSALLHAVTSAPFPTPIAAGCLLLQTEHKIQSQGGSTGLSLHLDGVPKTLGRSYLPRSCTHPPTPLVSCMVVLRGL
jgi:hypothetical protein